MDRVFSAARPTGKLHLGHLVGILRRWKKVQDEYECIFGVADWHALTTAYAESHMLEENVYDMVASWIAWGIDPKKSTLMVQSWAKEHCELMLLLGMLVPVPWLERVPTYKEIKRELADKDINNLGLLSYPVLQTADIIIYKAKYVPIGEDQIPHLELAREIVRRFNHIYRPVFPEPQPLLEKVTKLPGTDGAKKMSKSYGNVIEMDEPKESMWEKIRTMVTDTKRVRRTDPGTPEICPVHQYHLAFETDPETLKDLEEGCRTAKIGCIDCKKVLFERIWSMIEPYQERKREITKDKSYVWGVLEEGTKKAREIARRTVEEVYEAMGMHYTIRFGG